MFARLSRFVLVGVAALLIFSAGKKQVVSAQTSYICGYSTSGVLQSGMTGYPYPYIIVCTTGEKIGWGNLGAWGMEKYVRINDPVIIEITPVQLNDGSVISREIRNWSDYFEISDCNACSQGQTDPIEEQGNPICGWIENFTETGALAPILTVWETNETIDLVLLETEPMSQLISLGIPGYFRVYDPVFYQAGFMTNFSRIEKVDSCEISEKSIPQALSAPVFIYPQDGQALAYDGDYLFKVEPIERADGYLWGFFQNGEMVWENLRDEGTISSNEYDILSGSEAHSRFQPGEVEVWVRASVNGQWTEPTVIVLYLQTITSPALEVSDVQLEPSQVSVFELVRITMVVENKGAPLNQPFWGYTGEVILENENGEVIERHSFAKGDSSFISPIVEGGQVNFDKWLLTVKVRFGTAVSNGRVIVSVQPDIQQSELRGEGLLNISPGLSGLTCTSVIVNKLVGPFSSDVGKDLLDAITAELQAIRCGDGDVTCAVPPMVKGFVKILGRAILGSIGKIITGIWGVFDTDALQVCGNPVNWMWQLVREFNRQGVPISVSGVHSPMTILVTNSAGQRAGFVSYDEVVTEIADSRVIEWEGDKYVICLASPDITISLQAIGNGTVSVSLIDGQSGQEITYSNISVSDGDKAQIDLSDPQNQLVIDTNDDGNPDKVYSGTVEVLRILETPTASPTATSRPTEICGGSLGLIMLPLLAVLITRRFRKPMR